MNKQCVFIIVFFGKFNSYFQLFLNSCGFNSQCFDWLIFTDNPNINNYSIPRNVHVIHYTMKKFQEDASKKLGFQISLSYPYKLCDYKPAFGFLFEDYIKDYSYWGHCDCDTVIGDLNHFLTPKLNTKRYDMLFTLGHFIVYRNSFQNNRVFMNTFDNEIVYKDVFTSNNICVFDENFNSKRNVPLMFLEDGSKKIFTKDLSLNISTYFPQLIQTKKNEIDNRQELIKSPNQRFYYYNGRIISLSYIDGKIVESEFMYIHLQGRKMRFNKKKSNDLNYEILSDHFKSINKLPKTKKEMRLFSIKFTYFSRFDRIFSMIKKKLRLNKK